MTDSFDYKNDPKYIEAEQKYLDKKKKKQENKFKPQDVLTEYTYGETKRLL